GSSYTVNNTAGNRNQRSGASLRIVADPSDWDNSVGANNPGQSGDPSSPHYADLFPIWAANEFFPIYFSREKVDSAAESTLTLEPVS
ncbi:MAG: penicillin acylase family protein, partial [Candidatus Hydrogenedentota bacterium]